MRDDEITDEEIRKAHDLLLSTNVEAFSQEKIDILKCEESRDVLACPGSGKTTTLLAKLLILANRQPFSDGRGICVLTHTNVAIDEIKSKLGNKVDTLFSYPNFFGTIQSFVDKFFAIPFFNSYDEKYKVKMIDDEAAIPIIKKAIHSKYYEVLKNFFSLLSKKDNLIGELNDTIINSRYDVFEKKFYIKDLSGNYSKKVVNPRKERYRLLKTTRMAPFGEGILKFDDAYSFALAYIKHLPSLKEAISSRFRYLFIDEMQDTNGRQNELLEKVFDSAKVIIQRFGDDCQAIYDNEDQCDYKWEPNNPLPINDSLRFGENIARILRTVCINGNGNLVGNQNVPSLKPIMIVYDNPLTVLKKYTEILKTKTVDGKTIAEIAVQKTNEDALHRIFIKAIGWVAKDKGDTEITIPSYFPQYEKITKNIIRYDSDTLAGYLLHTNSNQPLSYTNSIINAFLKVLYIIDAKTNNKKYYSKKTLMDFIREKDIKEYEDFRLRLVKWSIDLVNCEALFDAETFNDIKTCIRNVFLRLFEKSETLELTSFLDTQSCEVNRGDGNDTQKAINVYRDGDVEIEVGTVHSVKGETHVATLYMESYYYGKYESEHFGRQLQGDAIRGKSSSRKNAALKIGYVGMSRASYLLCYAIKRENFEKIDCTKLRELWDVESAN